MARRARVKDVAVDQLHAGILPRATRAAFEKLTTADFLRESQWYLAGGTALALQIGHRQSEDLDFFTAGNDFDVEETQRELLAAGKWVSTSRSRGTLYGELGKSRVSFIAYPFFKPTSKRTQCGSIAMLVPEDIAAMKVVAVSQRGKKRDFIDLYWYCQNREPLDRVIRRAVRQFPGQEDNLTHILKSFMFFDDADSEDMPRLFFDVKWNEVKEFFLSEAPKLTRAALID